MSLSKSLNIHAWYLARLRNQATASSAQSQKLTPMALVESDKRLIQEIVTQAADSQTVRAKKFSELIESQRDWTRQIEFLLLVLALIGLSLIFSALLP